MESVVKRIEKLVNDGVFGNYKLLHIENNSDDGKAAQFASELFFLQMVLETVESNTKNRIIKLPMVVKIQAENAQESLMSISDQFANEVTTYEKILPKLGVQDLSPKMYYGFATKGKNPKEDLIVLEDMRPKGFRVANDILLDYDHVVLTMRKLGEFHGQSYKIKKTSPDEMKEMTEPLIPKKFPDSSGLFEGFMLRAMKPFLDKSPKYSIVNRAYNKIMNAGLITFCEALHRPEEPFAVIIHGDFNRNNLFYRYDNDKVEDVKFFDFGTSRYADPGVDMSFFLYMNTSSELRNDHWDDFLQAYWHGLTSVEPQPGFSIDEFMKNFAKHAIFGFHPASYFLPMMLFPETLLQPSQVVEMSPEDKFEWGVSKGGEKVTKVVSSIVKHLLERGYVEDFLLNLSI